jgi:phosphoserine phosphatase RsbU/P
VGPARVPRRKPPTADVEEKTTTTLGEVTTPLTPPSAADEKLRGVRAIADAALSRLDAEAFLVQLLERVKEILGVDTAAVLLLDPSSRELVATAATGLEEEVRQGVRIPMGKGFAGRVAAERRPVIIEHVDRTKVLNPILVEKGIRSLLGAPLMANGQILGVLHVGSLLPRSFTREDTDLLQLAADRAALAVQSIRARSDRAAAAALQRSLLPSALPRFPGTQMAARYVPGQAVVGGDWYDVFRLPSGELCVTMGDVAGAGLPAAVIMGRMRSALRAYALETTDPAAVLARLDAKMQHFEPDAMATVVYAVFAPALDVVRISSAGHFPPVVARPGEPARLADITLDLLIGVAPGVRRRATALPVTAGTALCFFTDGLVERRNRPLDDGLARLCDVVTAGPPEVICATVMGALIGREAGRDDIALLALRVEEPAAGE